MTYFISGAKGFTSGFIPIFLVLTYMKWYLGILIALIVLPSIWSMALVLKYFVEMG